MTQVLQFTENIGELITACHWDFSHSITNADLFREGAKNMPTGTFFYLFSFLRLIFSSFSPLLTSCFPSPGPDDCRKYPKNCFCFLFMPASIEKKSSCVIKNILWELIVLIIFIFILIVQCYIVCVYCYVWGRKGDVMRSTSAMGASCEDSSCSAFGWHFTLTLDRHGIVIAKWFLWWIFFFSFWPFAIPSIAKKCKTKRANSSSGMFLV